MSDEQHNEEYYRTRFKKLIWAVGGILILGTIITFVADLMGVFKDFDHAIVFALSVACIKASAVIAIFMHLWWDAKLKTISWTLICTIIFFIGMMWLTVGSEIDSVKPGHSEDTWNHVAIPTAPANPPGN